ncbi:hypothetical protein PTMSG1_03207 [Pyrenophora teres f. maculata]|nr:hypothetical protein PTMSG1_03207 [Pyrenophora teres f. maculata]
MPGLIQHTNDNDGPPSHVIGVYHITHPRSASNLFQNMMAKQPGYQKSGYKLYDAAFMTMAWLEDGPLGGRSQEERETLYETFRKGWEAMLDDCESAEREGKKVFIKEHAFFLSGPDKIFSSFYPEDVANLPPLTISLRNVSPSESAKHTNPTSLPDAFLLKMQPIFQIRHPALMYPSAIRAQRAINMGGDPSSHFDYFLTLRRSRELYDWYIEHGPSVGITPRVIDADDIMKDPEAVRKLCRQTGLDPKAVAYEWEEKVVESPVMARFLSTISKSRGILPGLAAQGLDMENQKERWREEFGEADAKALWKKVEESMGDYLYLWEKRTRGGGMKGEELAAP